MKDRSIREVHEEIVEEFEFLDDWMDRYQHIIDLGRQLPEFPKMFQNDDHRVRGCQAQVWMHSDCRNGRLHLQATSDAAIVSGLIAVLLRAYWFSRRGGLSRWARLHRQDRLHPAPQPDSRKWPARYGAGDPAARSSSLSHPAWLWVSALGLQSVGTCPQSMPLAREVQIDGSDANASD